ncbi:MAG: DNA gyrase inhibitor YacG [Rubrivivax sp.]
MVKTPNQDSRTVPCPGCGKPALFEPSNRWRPFCGERCRNDDLGAWASERFRVASDSPVDGDEQTPPSH